jgi:hypothetical protein
VTALYSDQAFDVELRAVTKRFGSLTAVNAVTLKVHKGEFLSRLRTVPQLRLAEARVAHPDKPVPTAVVVHWDRW